MFAPTLAVLEGVSTDNEDKGDPVVVDESILGVSNLAAGISVVADDTTCGPTLLVMTRSDPFLSDDVIGSVLSRLAFDILLFNHYNVFFISSCCYYMIHHTALLSY